MNSAPSSGKHLESTVVLLHLERAARKSADRKELAFVAVNDTHSLIPYRQAALWQEGRGVISLSGVAAADPHTPYVAWVNQVAAFLAPRHQKATPFTAEHLPPQEAEHWGAWWPAHALWLPLPESPAALLLVRDAPFDGAGIRLLTHLAEGYGHAWMAVTCRSGPWSRFAASFAVRPFLLRAAVIIAFLAMLALPVRQSALAPARVVARDPVLVRAPLDGVVERFHVAPNELVRAGAPLLDLDATRLNNRMQIADKELETAQAEYRQAAQRAVFDQKSKERLTLLRGEIEEKEAEKAYLSALLDRIHLRASRDGVVIFQDVNDWLGRPVTIGEKILEIADPLSAEIEMHLAVDDALALDHGAEVRLFLNIEPDHSWPAELRYASYQAETTPQGILSYLLKATFTLQGSPPRIGLTGTAKVYGKEVTLAYYLFRRPLAVARQWLGW